MPFYIGDYLADTQHLTTLQHGAYVLLIMHYWQRGSLPTDEQAIAGICRLNRTQWGSNSQAIAKLFLPGWKHKRIDIELEKMRIISEKRALAGQKGGSVSRGKTNGERFFSQAIAKQAGDTLQRKNTNLSSEYSAAREKTAPATAFREDAPAPFSEIPKKKEVAEKARNGFEPSPALRASVERWTRA